MGLTSAVHWWEESQMRVLVLSSLIVQFLLFIFSFMRRFSIPGCIRSTIWLVYLAADALAIYGLATLFNRHKDQQDHGASSRALEVIWAPILLMHLGGHDSITAYNIEDNELWSRHLVTAVSQVTVAVYVFCKTWPSGGDKRLLRAAILLLVPGVLKCFAKPWALKNASINSLVSSSTAVRTAKQKEGDKRPLENYVEKAKAFVGEAQEWASNGGHPPQLESSGWRFKAYMQVYVRQAAPLFQRARASSWDGDHHPSQQGGSNINPIQDPPRQSERDACHEKNEGEMMDPLEEYVKIAMAFFREWKAYRPPFHVHDHPASQVFFDCQKQMRRTGILHDEAYKLFVDLSSPYDRRLSIFKYFWLLSEDKASGTAYGSVREGLAGAFLFLYTKLRTAGVITESDLESAKVGSSWEVVCRQWILISRMVLPWAAIGLFHRSHREAYNHIDVKITYIMLCCTALIETYSIYIVLMGLLFGRQQWPEKIAQYSLIRYFSRDQRHSWIMWTVSLFGCKEFLDQRWCMSPSSKSDGIEVTGLVLRHLKAGWKERIQDVASYRRFNDSRGHWALESNRNLGWSIKGPFDESVLLWHIATDFCFYSRCNPRGGLCRKMSNYMVYLLFVNPEMLLPGTRRNLFTTAYDELKKILSDDKPSQQNPLRWSYWKPAPGRERKLMERLITNTKEKSTKASEEESRKGSEQESFIDDAWALAQGLLELKDDEKMWEVIQGVWVEMLCFSASRCRGYLHAKALSSGGEFLSYVWLLMSYMGMETFTERLQREELPSCEEENSADPPASDARNGTASSTTEIHTRAAPSTSEVHIDMF